jgi:hypothetical protein
VAYLPDTPTPLKRYGIGILEDCEEAILLSVAIHFNLPLYTNIYPDEVEKADAIMLSTEASQLLNVYHNDWGLPDPIDLEITPWTPKEAKFNFYAKYMDITGLTIEEAVSL